MQIFPSMQCFTCKCPCGSMFYIQVSLRFNALHASVLMVQCFTMSCKVGAASDWAVMPQMTGAPTAAPCSSCEPGLQFAMHTNTHFLRAGNAATFNPQRLGRRALRVPDVALLYVTLPGESRPRGGFIHAETQKIMVSPAEP